jgi:hypothetical protein
MKKTTTTMRYLVVVLSGILVPAHATMVSSYYVTPFVGYHAFALASSKGATTDVGATTKTGSEVTTKPLATDTSGVVQVLVAVAGFSGLFGLFWGIYQYRDGQIAKRKEVLFDLITEFDESEELLLAKLILADFILTPDRTTYKEQSYYTYTIGDFKAISSKTSNRNSWNLWYS